VTSSSATPPFPHSLLGFQFDFDLDFSLDLDVDFPVLSGAWNAASHDSAVPTPRLSELIAFLMASVRTAVARFGAGRSSGS